MSKRFQFLFLIALTVTGCKKDPVTTPEPDEGTDYSSCIITTSDQGFEVMTWNLEQYPISSFTMEEVSNVITSLDPDVVALQEITSEDVFNTLVDNLDGWEGSIAVSGNLNLAFLYKPSEITLLEPVSQIITDNSYAFPRPPAIIKIEHELGQVYLVDIHLKCCDGTENVARRKEAASLIKTYIDENLPNDRVVVLGDFNDEIYSSDGSEDTFNNFIDDPDNYKFADMDIAMGNESGWSYPGWPSHIDHILITNEFFGDQLDVNVLQLNNCYENYFSWVSDHRPVIMRVE